ncbi:hypothetical protein CK203_117290 [Vitis vinifera]|uniref:Uncharacterized protein n=1 Tax=Vitis vinifera TaxID=29760 RepID=A0A438CU84_VITVI|nr:hypothetical protein CK203_117290 [Vitis vinifera]
MWFEAISRLRINLGKSEILPVGRAENVEILALELGCKVGALPSTWGSPWVHHTNLWWFGMGWRRGFGRGYPCGRDKIFLKELIWSTLSSMTIYFMSLMRKPRVQGKGWPWHEEDDSLNKALLGKWVWRFAVEKDNLWRVMIGVKYGQEEFGWKTKEGRGAYGVGAWKEIMKEANWCWEISSSRLSHAFPLLYEMAINKNATVNEMWDHSSGPGGWNLRFHRDFNDWELDLIRGLLIRLKDVKLSSEEDGVLWKGGAMGSMG